ncbi:hypothetical protein [Alsobacter sp. SYSU BS001988]|jgi:hypothetical protein
MRRFFRHPLHRAAAVVLVCAALLGYGAPALATEPSLKSALLVAIGVCGLAVSGYRAYAARARRRAAAERDPTLR